MKKIQVKSSLALLVIAIVFTVIYVALTEQFTLLNAAIGFVISIIALILTQKVFLTTRYLDAFSLSGWYIVYVGYLVFVILKSAIVSISYIFSRDISINLIPYQTKLKDKNLKSMLSNAITLTPGTVTADIKEDTIEVMKMCKGDNLDQTLGFAKIEKILKRMEKDEAA